VLSFDDLLSTTIITYRLSGLYDAVNQRGLADHLAKPELLSQFALGYYPVVVVQQVGKDVEDLGRDLDGLAITAR
jgi:hypothetical protein